MEQNQEKPRESLCPEKEENDSVPPAGWEFFLNFSKEGERRGLRMAHRSSPVLGPWLSLRVEFRRKGEGDSLKTY